MNFIFISYIRCRKSNEVCGQKLFLEYLTLERNYSLRTVEEYRDDLNAFESYYKKVDSALSWETMDGDVVRDWMGLDDGGEAVRYYG